jgi:penicillin G amidase
MTDLAARRRALGTPLRLLVSATTVSGLGDGMRITALAVFAAALTRDPLLVATVTVAGQLSVVLIGPFTGVLADHIDRRRALWRCDAARAVMVSAFLILIATRLVSIPILAGTAFLLGAVETLAFNLTQAITPGLVDPVDLDSANARLQAGPFISAQLIGAPIGALLFVLRRSLPFIVDAASFAISALLVFGIRGPWQPVPDTKLTARTFRRETAEGFAWLWRHRLLRAVCVLMGLSNTAVLGVLAIAVLYALEDLHISRAAYGLLLAVVALGGLLGLAAAPPLASRLGDGRALALTFALCPASFVLGGITSNPWVAAVAFALVGGSVSVSIVVSATLRQLLIPTELFGRVNGAFWLVVGGMEPLGALLGGYLAREFGLRSPFFVGAGVLAVAACAAIPLLARRDTQTMLASARAESAARSASAGHPVPAGASRWDTAKMRISRRVIAAFSAVGVSAALLGLLAAGFGPVPALGSILNPGRGVWDSAAAGMLPSSQRLRIAGLSRPARITFTSAGIASIQAASDADAFLALGYLHARFRFTQMDLERRLGEGRLSQLIGAPAVSSDKFELQLGLLRTAQAEWAQLPPRSVARGALIDYAAGVNDWISQAKADHQLPAIYALTGVLPGPWQPVDSLVVQEVLTEDLDFTTSPLDYSLLYHSLGPRRTMQWFPVLPADPQRPYQPGPYRYRGIGSLSASNANAGGAPAVADATAGQAIPSAGMTAAALLAEIRALPASEVHTFPDSNAWAANGPKVTGAKSMLAGDPHLSQTLPAYWFEVALRSPGLAVTGVSLPGIPGILLGHNLHITWSITNTENQSTLFYVERTSRARPDQYYWRGTWRRMEPIRYQIPVHGGPTVRLTVLLSVHGPVMTQARQTTSVDWMGDYPTNDLAAILAVDRAATFGQFRQALSNWHAPTLNFVYADDRGNIGAISAGYYPLTGRGSPWLPLPGTGPYDVIGTIPYDAVPQVFDPADHIVATANQRPVGPGYPYYIGTTMDNFDYGYRADAIYRYLESHKSFSVNDFANLQGNVTDHLATLIVPALLAALERGPLTPRERSARRILSQWKGSMGVRSPAATLWWTFWSDYLSSVFEPWWRSERVPIRSDPAGLAVSTDLVSLDQDLEFWTLRDPSNSAFSLPGGSHREAGSVMRAAFAAAIRHLSRRLGPDPGRWAWGRLHSREFPSLTQAPALGYGPRPASGDPWTIDAADGGMVSNFGPSWRMLVSWTGLSQGHAQGVYPGGQSENPASPWYQNFISDWWTGRYVPLPPTSGPVPGTIIWALYPAGSNR